MDHLVHVEEKEITINFELGRKCKTTLRFRSLMHTMPVAFKLQTTSPNKFSVRPSNGYVKPLGEFALDIILKPQQEPPPTFPFSDEKFVLKTALAPLSNNNSDLPERVCNEWFSSPATRVYTDAKLKVVYIGARLLRQCVAREDVFAVEQMLLRQTRVSVAAEDGTTALHVAASNGSSKLVGMLLQCGAEIDAMDVVGRTPLWEAISGGHVDVVKELLARGAHIDIRQPFRNNTAAAIHEAATLASPKVLEVLIANGASLETKDPEGRTALHFAVEAGRMESLKVLLCAGADTNAQRVDGRTPLLIAAESGSFEMVHLLLEGGANANIKAQHRQQLGSKVATGKGHVVIVEALKAGEGLLRAARQGDAKAVATLLQHGNTARARDTAGWTALHVAAFKGHVHIVHRLLLANGGTKALHERDKEGYTPLHCAAAGGSREVVELLLAMGANPLATSSRGATPAALANALGFTSIARLLQHQAPCRRAIDRPCQGQLELDAKGVERVKSGLLRRRSISPSPDPSSLRARSATPSPKRKEALTASSIRFSTPNRLPQRKQNEPCSNPSSLRICTHEVPQYTKEGSLMGKKNLAPCQPQASFTSDMRKSSNVQSAQQLDAQKVLQNAAQSKHPSLQAMPPSAPGPLKATKVEETESTHVQHGQKSNKEDCNIATSMPQHTTLENTTNLPNSYNRHPKRTLANLLDRFHGSKMGVVSSSSRKAMQSKVSSDKSTTKKVPIPTSDMVSKDRKPLQNQVKDRRNLNNSSCNSARQNAASQHQQRKSVTKEVVIPTLDKGRASIHNHGCVAQGDRRPVAPSLLSKKTQQACGEAQTRLCEIDMRQQLENGAELKGCFKDPQKLDASVSTNENRRNYAIVSLSIDNPLSATQPQFKHEGIGDLGFNTQNEESSSLPCPKMDGSITVKGTSCPTSGRALVSHSDITHILTACNPVDSVLPRRSHMEHACPSVSTSSSSVQISPDKLLQSLHNNHFTSPDAPQMWQTHPNRETMRDVRTHIMPPQSALIQSEEAQSLKPICREAWNNQNRPVYTPPLRIKQMRKPMSTPILRNSISPQQLRTEEVPTQATGTSEEKAAKTRSVTVRELFSQTSF